MKKYITNCKIVSDGKITDSGIAVQNGKIIDITDVCPDGYEVIDLGGDYISAGFIELHCHGGGGFEFIDGDEDAVLNACKIHADGGTRVMYPTISATDYDTMYKALETIERVKDKAPLYIAGVHLEGPYLNPEMCGAQDDSIIRYPDKDEYTKIIERFSHLIARWDYAPERDMDNEFLNFLSKNNIVASSAHTAAKYDDMQRAYDGGNRLVTHLYSCTSTVTREGGFRKLGVIESAFLNDGIFAEVIGDGAHIPPELMRMIFKIKGADRLCLVTDAIRFAGCEGENEYNGKIPYVIEDGVAKLADRSAFAGSIATMQDILKKTAEAGISLADTVTMLTKTPATVMGLENFGEIKTGYNAVFTVFDKKLNIKKDKLN